MVTILAVMLMIAIGISTVAICRSGDPVKRADLLKLVQQLGSILVQLLGRQ
jgi:hypothetical protein